MIYSGTDLLKTSGAQQTKLERLRVAAAVAPVTPAGNPDSNPEQDSHGALLRFARFIHKEGERSKLKRPRPAALAGQPYLLSEERRQALFDRGRVLDIII